MKKIIKILIGFIIFFISLFFIATKWNSGERDYNINTAQFNNSLSPVEVLDKIEDRETGIYYFGYSTCPWCIEIVPILDEILRVKNTQAVVVNTKSESFSEEIRKRFEEMYRKHSKEDIVVPFIVVVDREGNITTHSGTIEEHDARRRKLIDKEKEQLKEKLVRMMEKI